MASAVPSLPLGFVASMYMTEIWSFPSIAAAIISVVLVIAFSMLVSMTMGLLFLADHKRLSK